MHTTTRELLEGVRDSETIMGATAKIEVAAALQCVGLACADVQILRMKYEEMRDAETDPAIRAQLGEIEQKLKVLDREYPRLRENYSRVRRAIRELEDLMERLVTPLLLADEEPPKIR